MNYKGILIIITTILFTLSCKESENSIIQSEAIIQVEYPEAYELENIILSLTDYGKNDKWEVRQGFDYYEKVQEYFITCK